MFAGELDISLSIGTALRDENVMQMLAQSDSECIGTASATLVPHSAIVLIEHVAVLKAHRRQGVGSRLVLALELAPELCTAKTFALNVDASARAFYEKMGYRPFGSPFQCDGIEHQSMRKYRL